MSNEPTIAEMNYIIGVFDGRSFSGSHITDYAASDAPKMKYHSSWNCLMPVVRKIYNTLAEMLRKRPPHTACHGDMIEVDIHCAIREVDIVKTHGYVYQFIQWYNKQSTTTNEITP